MKKNKKISTEQKAKLIATYLLKKKNKSTHSKQDHPTPWKTLISFRNV